MRSVGGIMAVCLAVAACHGGSSSGEGGSVSQSPRRVLSQNRYWAKPGKVDEVYAWRLHATDVQVEMGLPRGRVLRGGGGEARVEGGDTGTGDAPHEGSSPESGSKDAMGGGG
jgi:hypothetical protein